MLKDDEVYTYADYLSWPDDERWELIEGVAWNMCAAPNTSHQSILGEMYIFFHGYFEEHQCQVFLAPFDVLLPDFACEPEEKVRNVVQPDIVVICDKSKLTEKNCFGPPDLLLEIVSPSTSKKDLNEKFRLYEKHGIREYWIVDGYSRHVQVYTRINNRYREPAIFFVGDKASSKIFPGLGIELGSIFPR
jgi:Uma2 family endonuclease